MIGRLRAPLALPTSRRPDGRLCRRGHAGGDRGASAQVSGTEGKRSDACRELRLARPGVFDTQNDHFRAFSVTPCEKHLSAFRTEITEYFCILCRQSQSPRTVFPVLHNRPLCHLSKLRDLWSLLQISVPFYQFSSAWQCVTPRCGVLICGAGVSLVQGKRHAGTTNDANKESAGSSRMQSTARGREWHIPMLTRSASEVMS